MDNKETFNYTYSAKQQEEIKAIRDRYTVQEKEYDKMTMLRRLDAQVNSKAQAVSLAFGVIGVLLLGVGMSMCMTDIGQWLFSDVKLILLIGIIIGVLGIVFVCLAYPVYSQVLKTERKKIAPEVLRLTDELLK